MTVIELLTLYIVLTSIGGVLTGLGCFLVSEGV